MARSNSTRRNTAFDLSKAQFLAPQTRLDANRWLNYATFGPGTAETDIAASTKTTIVPLAGTQDDATQLMSVGYASYLNTQFSDNTIPLIYANGSGVTPLANSNSEAGNFGGNGATSAEGFLSWFYTQAVHGSAQVRLKTAYALSQIFVINGSGALIKKYQVFYDILVKATLSTNTSSFKELLRQVTYSKAMSIMLTYNGNVKENLSTNSHPDENFAREILQLFSIGLKQLNVNGEPILDANGLEIPTYTPQDIPQVAKFFTGLIEVNENTNFRQALQEVLYQNDHETGAKTLFAYPGASPVTIPAYTGTYFRPVDTPPNLGGYVIKNVTANTFQIDLDAPSVDTRPGLAVEYSLVNDRGAGIAATTDFVFLATTQTITKTAHGLTNGTRIYIYSTAQKDFEYILEYIFQHPNVAPFISKSLIKFFVTSNPTPDYVKRVANVFINNGNGIRGDISSVVKAILSDREAIVPFGINPNNHGRYTTLVDRYIRVAKAFKSDMFHALGSDTTLNQLAPGGFGNNFIANSTYFTKPRNLKDYRACGFQYTGSIQPQQSSSVFNFFRPGYTPPGTNLGTIGKTSPELQINTVDTQIVWANAINSLCETENPPYDESDYSNPVGQSYSLFGFDFTPNTGGFTVTVAPTANYGSMTVSGVCNSNVTSVLDSMFFSARRRSDGYIARCYASHPIGTGTKTFTVQILDNLTNVAVNDVFDFSPLAIFSQAGWPSASIITGGNALAKQVFQPCIMTFHKIANLISDAAAIPTDTDLIPAINYIESIFMGKPISTSLRTLMTQAGQVPSAANPPTLVGDATFTNNWLNITMGHAQKRARRMVGILLVSQEFITLN